ncbi:MAG: MarR family transcriptional regulator [Gemmatimonadaceae bacterium]
MTGSLQAELHQRKAFTSLHQEAHLNIVRTEAALGDDFEQMLKPYGISGTQFNVLRILRGAEPEGLCRNELRDRLVTRMPDVTRLLDRMEDLGLIVRTRDTSDRRLVSTGITKQGRRLVDDLDEVVQAEHQRSLGHLNKKQLATLIELLTLVRRTNL